MIAAHNSLIHSHEDFAAFTAATLFKDRFEMGIGD
jgi:hypothetical protein